MNVCRGSELSQSRGPSVGRALTPPPQADPTFAIGRLRLGTCAGPRWDIISRNKGKHARSQAGQMSRWPLGAGIGASHGAVPIVAV